MNIIDSYILFLLFYTLISQQLKMITNDNRNIKFLILQISFPALSITGSQSDKNYRGMNLIEVFEK